MSANPLREARLQTPNGNVVMVPMDHGISMGPLAGLVKPRETMQAVTNGGATCIVTHKGLHRELLEVEQCPGTLLHVSASTDVGPDAHEKRIVGTVKEAVRMGFDGVSIHLNMGANTEPLQLEQVGLFASECNDYGMPLLAMVYPRGPQIKNPQDPTLVAHAARLGVEIGADIVKVPYTGDPVTFEAVVEAACGVPVVTAGGAVRDFQELLGDLRDMKSVGGRGVSMGRNVFSSADPEGATRAIREIFS